MRLARPTMSRSIVALATFLPLLILILNLTANTPPPRRKLRVATTSAKPTSHSPPPPDASPPPPPPSQPCNGTEHVELWGALVLAGPDNEQSTASACCQSCRAYEPTLDVLQGGQCNTWVWHPTSKHCWLKHQKRDDLERSAARLTRPSNSNTPWHSGVLLELRPCLDCVAPAVYTGCIGKDRCNTSRACGSPAIDGYAHVAPRCVEQSPTATRYAALLRAHGSEMGSVLEAHHELHADYDGLGVRWGIGNKKPTWQACEASCRAFNPASSGGAPFRGLPCNTWTWCSEPVCFEPDAHKHSLGDCWLKFQELPEAPEVNMRTPGMRPAFMKRHRKEMAGGCSWHSGVMLPPGTKMTNGTWGPRAYW